jgi:hypothetical protein
MMKSAIHCVSRSWTSVGLDSVAHGGTATDGVSISAASSGAEHTAEDVSLGALLPGRKGSGRNDGAGRAVGNAVAALIAEILPNHEHAVRADDVATVSLGDALAQRFEVQPFYSAFVIRSAGIVGAVVIADLPPAVGGRGRATVPRIT